jgi:hypothetical protein
MKPALRIAAISAVLTVLLVTCGQCSVRDDFKLMVKTSIGRISSADQPVPPVTIGVPGPSDRKSVARAMILSAVLPGLGQMYAGGTRGYAVGGTMAAVDVFSAWQYYYNNKEGDERKTKYKDFARDHYDRDRFRDYVRDTVVVFSRSDVFDDCMEPGSYDSPECSTSIHNIFPLSDRDDAAYYEQIGDEDRFLFGWDDWNPYVQPDHEDYWIDWYPYGSLPSGIPRTSKYRDDYSEMKEDADDFYGKADVYAWVMVVNRVVSMVDAAILVKLRNRDLAAIGDNPRLTFKAGLDGGPNFRVGLKMRF